MRGSVGRQDRRPVLRLMQHAQDPHTVIVYPVGREIGRAIHYPFACAEGESALWFSTLTEAEALDVYPRLQGEHAD